MVNTKLSAASGMNDQEDQAVEGIETEIASASWGDYPLDSVFVRREERTVNEVVQRINKGRYKLDPDFQRTFVWESIKQSKLIESCLMRIPLPVFYVAEAKDGRIVVVDGLQRLTTLQRYIGGKFALELGKLGDDAPHPLNGKRFSTLPVTLQERVQDTPLIFYILDAKAPERARLDIFDRVNSGVPLSRQQMRNSLYSGTATQWLRDAAASPEFLKATGHSLDQKTMRDREVINRFCAFHLLGRRKYASADMDGFLGNALGHMNKLSVTDLADLMSQFKNSMDTNRLLFGDHAFRKSMAENDPYQRRSPINVSLFDVCSVLLVNFPTKPPKGLQAQVSETIRKLIHDEEFNFAITYSTNSTKQVVDRFAIFEDVLEDLI